MLEKNIKMLNFCFTSDVIKIVFCLENSQIKKVPDFPPKKQFVIYYFQLFEERKTLIGHWFEHWTDSQRRQFLEHLVAKFNKVRSRARGQFGLLLLQKAPSMII